VFLLHIAFLVTAYAFPSNMPAVLSMLLVAYGVYFLNVIQYIVRHNGMKNTGVEPDLAEAA
jgi:hypothetical protein